MQSNQALLEKFYKALQSRDADTLAECYHSEAGFSDEVFRDLKGKEVPAMWRMLFGRGGDLSVEYQDIQAGPEAGSGHWDATYTFSQSGRKVINRIDSAFQFKDGLIFRQRDTFDFWKWSRQALGTTGRLLGWLPPFQKTVQKRSRGLLDNFMKKQTTTPDQ
jgi:hypothetical protein